MAEEGFRRKLTAILSADVEGYSRLMGDDEEATIRTLTKYRNAMTDLIQQYRGRVVDTPGDNILAEFASVVDAVQCAVEIQQVLKSKNAELSEKRRMKFRIGVNLGDVIQEGDRIYGDGVNIAARIESLAEPGGICISRPVYDQIKKKLVYDYEYMGEHNVKNIYEPIRAYKIPIVHRLAIEVHKEKGVGPKKWKLTAPESAKVLGSFDRPSIVVLPFVNMSNDPTQEYFVDGMTDDLITDLSKISNLLVISRNSTFTYKGKAVMVQQLAEELGTQYVLEGSVRKAGERIRINAQLIDATSDRHLWAERYDGKIHDVFELQDKITQKIVAALKIKLTSREQKSISFKETKNVEAHNAYLQGLKYDRTWTVEGILKAIPYYEKAIKIDQNYGRSYAALAFSYFLGPYEKIWKKMGTPQIVARLRARKYLEMAMKNPTGTAHYTASYMACMLREYEAAIVESERAIALEPSYQLGYLGMARALIFDGQPEEAIPFIKKSIQLNPLILHDSLAMLGLVHFCMGQLDEAAKWYERSIAHNPEHIGISGTMAATYALLGRDKDARSSLDIYLKMRPYEQSVATVMRYYPFKNIKVADRFAEGLIKAGLPNKSPEYYKLYQDHKLTGEEIRAFIGRKISGFDFKGNQWWQKIYHDERTTWQHSKAGSFDGSVWVEDHKAFMQFPDLWEGLKIVQTIYRNPDGTPEKKNEYISVTDYNIFAWSIVD